MTGSSFHARPDFHNIVKEYCNRLGYKMKEWVETACREKMDREPNGPDVEEVDGVWLRIRQLESQIRDLQSKVSILNKGLKYVEKKSNGSIETTSSGNL